MYWPLYLAYKHLFPSGKKGSFFAWVAIAGVMLGVMVLIIVQCIMGGFGAQIRQLVVETAGDIRVQSPVLIDQISIIDEILTAHQLVQGVAPYAEGVVMLQHEARPAFPFMRGVEVDRERMVTPFNQYMLMGDFSDLTEDGILLSRGLADRLGTDLGSIIWVYSPLMLEKLTQEEILMPQELMVVGVFETGWNQVDDHLAVVALPTFQEIYGIADAVHGFSLRLKQVQDEDAVVNDLNQKLPYPVYAQTVLSAHEDLLFILRLEKTTLFFIILFVILVAAFSITSSLMTTVVRKTKEIGLLRALGAKPSQIAGCFCFQGAIIGVAGTFLGLIGALIALHFRNDVIGFLARMTDSQEALLKFYQFAHLPVAYDPIDFWIILPTAILIATSAGFFPAWKAARCLPADALRIEN